MRKLPKIPGVIFCFHEKVLGNIIDRMSITTNKNDAKMKISAMSISYNPFSWSYKKLDLEYSFAIEFFIAGGIIGHNYAA